MDELEARRVSKARKRAEDEAGCTLEPAIAMECCNCGNDTFRVWANNVISCANPKCRTKIRNLTITIDHKE